MAPSFIFCIVTTVSFLPSSSLGTLCLCQTRRWEPGQLFSHSPSRSKIDLSDRHKGLQIFAITMATAKQVRPCLGVHCFLFRYDGAGKYVGVAEAPGVR
jgi:hypothetical protein